MSKTIGVCIASLVLACACTIDKAEQDVENINAHEAFARIETGASRAEVERLLGSPVLIEEEQGVDVGVWYLSPPELGPADSPWGPGSVYIRFVDDRVELKKLHPQVRR